MSSRESCPAEVPPLPIRISSPRCVTIRTIVGSYDNALAESINGLYKAQAFAAALGASVSAVQIASVRWLNWFNPRSCSVPSGTSRP